MIGGCSWVPPNVRLRVREADGEKELVILVRTSPKKELRRRLERKGLEILSARRYDFNKEWLAEAKKLDAQVAAAAGRADRKKIFDANPMWGDLKFHLFDLFHGKCAYCEARPTVTGYGDVEHFRPKGRIQGEPKHPGYYWLAYDPTNYLPACQLCNQQRKRMKFPVENGTRAFKPQDVARESPRLLNPQEPDFDERRPRHLVFVVHKNLNGSSAVVRGKAHGLTDKGRDSIDAYGLNRGGLFEERLGASEKLQEEWDAQVKLLGRWPFVQKRERDLRQGNEPYTAALLDEFQWLLAREIERHEAELKRQREELEQLKAKHRPLATEPAADSDEAVDDPDDSN